jgi:hypothetical protein
LAAVDIEVQRLPGKIVFPRLGSLGVRRSNRGFATRDEALLGRSAIGGLATLVGFVALHLGSRGGLGSGDVKLGCSHPDCCDDDQLDRAVWALMPGCLAALLGQ